MDIYLGDGDAGHVLDSIFDCLLQSFCHLRNVCAIFEVDADVDDCNIVVEADLNRSADAAFFQKVFDTG